MRVAVLLVLIVLPACTGGQSGDTIGPQQCDEDVECAHMRTFIEGLDQSEPDAPMFESARCMRVSIPPPGETNQGFGIGDGDDVACFCNTADGTLRGHMLYAGNECLVRSRGRECLYAADEFPGCDPNDAENAACTAICDELTGRVAEDAARVFDASVRSNRCRGGDCKLVVEIDGRCYAGTSKEAQDCSLSDDEILLIDEQSRPQGIGDPTEPSWHCNASPSPARHEKGWLLLLAALALLDRRCRSRAA
jgi:hypothetical protein